MPSILHLVSATLSPMNMWTVCHPYISLYARILNWPSPEMTMSRTSHPPKNGRVLKLPLFDSPKFLTLPFFLEWQVLDLVISGRGHIWQQNVSIVALLPNICCKHFFSHCFFFIPWLLCHKGKRYSTISLSDSNWSYWSKYRFSQLRWIEPSISPGNTLFFPLFSLKTQSIWPLYHQLCPPWKWLCLWLPTPKKWQSFKLATP